MSDDKTASAAPNYEILAPERSGAVRESDRPMMVSAFNRVRNKVIKKELNSFTAKARSWNEVVAALRDGERLREEYQAALIRSEHLPLLRAAEEAKIFAEVQRIFDNEADRQRDRTIRSTRAEAELIMAKRDLDALMRSSDGQPGDTRSTRRVAAIKRIREERDEMIVIIVEGRTEEQMSEEDKHLLNDIRLAADNEIKNVLEEGRD